MTDDIETIPTTSETVNPGRFPAMVQLGVLGLILVFIFAGALSTFIKSQPEKVAEEWLHVTPENSPSSVFTTTSPVINENEIQILAKSAYVYDIVARRALYNKNADEVLPLASITKLMTGLLTHELLSESMPIDIPASAIKQDGDSGIREGDKVSVGSLTDYALMASSNDSAFALAASVGKALTGEYDEGIFVEAMNIRAKELELNTLKFNNSTGLDVNTVTAGGYGSARDVSFLLTYIWREYPQLLYPSSQSATRIYNEEGGYYEAENTNRSLEVIPNLLGSKTGYTDLAGGNLTIVFDAGFNRPVVITVLGSSFYGRFNDVETLTKAVVEAFGKIE